MREWERDNPTWVWADTNAIYPRLLAAGIRVSRCVDLRLSHVIVRDSLWSRSAFTGSDPLWDRSRSRAAAEPTLFLDDAGAPASVDQLRSERELQQRAVAAGVHPGRLRMLLAAESAGALAASEMRHTGTPFAAAVHAENLRALLGDRPQPGARPARMEELADAVRAALACPTLNPDSQPAVLKALRDAGIKVDSTRQHELERHDHPAIGVLLQYKKLSRLYSANGWAWMQEWVREDRYRPEYVPGGVVTGRWATDGGGGLQLPRQIRSAVAAAPGWKLVLADAAQLEPRILAAISEDPAMAAASTGRDLYQALVDQGVVSTRAEAKIAMLAALYGATTGQSGAALHRLRAAFPTALALVEHAALQGERGDQVTTWLGRTSPPPGEWFRVAQDRAAQPDAGPADERLARQRARDWGRFTRNFVVQGTAAEWALCWLASIRRELAALDRGAELVYFLHDEVMVHCPAPMAEQVADVVNGAAAQATHLLFGATAVEFPLSVTVVDNYAQAK